jgi:hypothetical protein
MRPEAERFSERDIEARTTFACRGSSYWRGIRLIEVVA